jgi:hypothetical protein
MSNPLSSRCVAKECEGVARGSLDQARLGDGISYRLLNERGIDMMAPLFLGCNIGPPLLSPFCCNASYLPHTTNAAGQLAADTAASLIVNSCPAPSVSPNKRPWHSIFKMSHLTGDGSNCQLTCLHKAMVRGRLNAARTLGFVAKTVLASRKASAGSCLPEILMIPGRWLP